MPKPSRPRPQSGNAARPVPADAVRVWRGYRLPTLSPQAFLSDLGGVFIPITAQLQRLYGLTAYLPAVLPLVKPEGLPDEIALVFYQTQQAYNDTKLRVAGRAYSLLHSAVFAGRSQSSFPTPLQNQISFDTAYHLFPDEVDWQLGLTRLFVGARPDGVAPEKFASQVLRFLSGLVRDRPAGLEGVVVCPSANWLLYWEHWPTEESSLKGRISDLARLAMKVLLGPARSVSVPQSLTGPSPGLTVAAGEVLNVTFPRL